MKSYDPTRGTNYTAREIWRVTTPAIYRQMEKIQIVEDLAGITKSDLIYAGASIKKFPQPYMAETAFT